MNLHDVIAEFEAEIAAFFSRFRSHPAVQAATVEAAGSPGAGMVTMPAPAEPAPLPNRFVAMRAKYANLWDLMKGENISITAADLPLAAAADFAITDGIRQFVAGRPAETAGPAFDPHKTALDVSTDGGKLFEPPLGETTYTVTGPASIGLAIDGTEVLGETASYSIDGAPFEQQIGTGIVGRVGPEQHTVVVRHNVVVGKVRFQINPA